MRRSATHHRHTASITGPGQGHNGRVRPALGFAAAFPRESRASIYFNRGDGVRFPS